MEMGCGLSVKIVKNHRYLHFWSYASRFGRSSKLEKYIGFVGLRESNEKAVRLLLEHGEKVKRETEARIAMYRRALDGRQGQ